MSTTIRRLTFVVVLLAGLLLAAPAQAANQLSGTAYLDASRGADCPAAPEAYDDHPALVLSGSLEGCWYTHVETARTTPGSVYLESGRELFVGITYVYRGHIRVR